MTDTPSWQDLLDLVAQLNGSDYESASVQFGDVSVRLSKSGVLDTLPVPERSERSERSRGTAPLRIRETAAPDSYVSTPVARSLSGVSEANAVETQRDLNTIDAPMIGVFYRRPAPGADPFVQPGDTVSADTTIGIVEIMKLMNPITAGKAGVLGEFLVEDGQAVEFGQPLVTLS